MANYKNYIGEKFGHWIVVAHDDQRTKETKKQYWVCECDCGCGTTKSIRIDALRQTKVGGCDNIAMTVSKKCLKCGKEFFPKKQAKTRQYCYECMPIENYSRTDFSRQVKLWGLEYKGKKCNICGYDKCIAALEFHHLEEKTKEFELSSHESSTNWEDIKKELDKCIVVCANCHREIHYTKESD